MHLNKKPIQLIFFLNELTASKTGKECESAFKRVSCDLLEVQPNSEWKFLWEIEIFKLITQIKQNINIDKINYNTAV